MQVSAIANQAVQPSISSPAAAGGPKAGGKGFGEMLEGMLHDLNGTSQNATNMAGALAAGDDVDVHQVALAAEMESLSFSLALQVRNKVVDAYHEIMKMPV